MAAKTEKMEFRCSPKLRAALEQVAEAQEMTLSEVIRAACEDYTFPYRSIRVPLIGTISGQGIELNQEQVTL